MRKALTEKDIAEIKLDCRWGYVIPAMLFLVGTIIVSFFHATSTHCQTCWSFYVYNALAWLALSIFCNYLMNHKKRKDLRFKEKRGEVRIIQQKQKKRDWEAGSGNVTTMPHNRPMTEFARFDFIIDNTFYRVDEELFNQCEDGDEVILYYSVFGNYFLGIEKK